MKKQILIVLALASLADTLKLQAVSPETIKKMIEEQKKKKAGVKTINLIVGEQKFEVPQAVAMEALTLKQIAEDLGIDQDLELSAQISSAVMKYVAQIMWSYHDHKDFKNKALFDAIEKDVSFKDAPLIDLIQAFNYLDFPIGLELIARSLAGNPVILKPFMEDISLKDLQPLVAKYYYLLHLKNLPDVDEKKYGFSIQDYLDYQPQVIIAQRSGYELALIDMRLNSLEGIGNIQNRSDLKELYLNSNQLDALPVGIFNGFVNLQELYLNDNSLNVLSAGSFNGLTNLQVLNLSRTSLITLPMGIFNGLTNLRDLALHNNKLNILPVGIFNGLSKLTDLILDGNQINEIPSDVFTDVPNLLELSLRNNQINEIFSKAFIHLTDLQRLTLSGNPINTIHLEGFSGLNNLQRLFLSDVKISTISAGVFTHLINLQLLDLRNGQLNESNKKELRDALPNVYIDF